MKTHRTKDGQSILLCCMKDDHLKNCLHLMKRRFTNALSLLGIKSESNPMYIANGIDMDDYAEQARDIMESIGEALPFYIMEAQIRGIDCSEILQEMYMRKEYMEPIFGEQTKALGLEMDDEDFI